MSLPAPPAAWVALSLVEHLGGRKLRALLAAFDGDVEAVLAADARHALQRVPGIGPKLSAAIRAVSVPSVARDIARWQSQGVLLLASGGPGYPARTEPDGQRSRQHPRDCDRQSVPGRRPNQFPEDDAHLHIEKPGGTELHLTYPGGLAKVGVGVYEHAITPDTAGVWWYRFSGENGGQLVTATEDMKFQVYATRMSL